MKSSFGGLFFLFHGCKESVNISFKTAALRVRSIHYHLPISDHVYSVIKRDLGSECKVQVGPESVAVFFLHPVAPAARCRGCLQALGYSIHSTSTSTAADIFFHFLIKYEFMNLDKPHAGNSAAREELFLSHTNLNQCSTENLPLLLIWLILFIFYRVHGHFKVRAMSSDPWPSCYWLLVILAMQDLLQPYTSFRKLQLNGCFLNRLSTGFRLNTLSPSTVSKVVLTLIRAAVKQWNASIPEYIYCLDCNGEIHHFFS